MMVYILDTNIFRKILEHFPKKGGYFERIWNSFEAGIKKGVYQSVDECFNELSAHFDDKSANMLWLKGFKQMFLPPTNNESLILRELFEKPKMRESIHIRNILNNRPSADPYIAAKAKSIGAIVVTTEVYKPHSAQLPNVCEELGVQCISYDDFMEIVAKEDLSE